MPTQNELVNKLVRDLTASPSILNYARNIATTIVQGPAHHCAATLSSLLVFTGIYPNGGGTGSGDLEPYVPYLVYDLEHRRQWSKVDVSAQILSGDVGVVLVDADTHHIYLVMDVTDETNPLIADNQGVSFHQRPVAGNGANYSPTNYFLRSPKN